MSMKVIVASFIWGILFFVTIWYPYEIYRHTPSELPAKAETCGDLIGQVFDKGSENEWGLLEGTLSNKNCVVDFDLSPKQFGIGLVDRSQLELSLKIKELNRPSIHISVDWKR